jgi:dihydroorotase
MFLQNVQIIDKTSPFHLKRSNVLIADGQIAAIGNELSPTTHQPVMDCLQLSLSVGWVDMCAWTGGVGYEHREDFASLCRAAAAAGFTEVLVLPNMQPFVQHKEAIGYIRSQSQLGVQLLPIGGLSMQGQGEEMTELLDMHHAGAVAFSDGLLPMTNTALLLKCLLYLQHCNGLLINRADDKHLSKYGQMNESEVSVFLGLKGIPHLAESLGLQRDLQLLAYTGGKIHFSCISTAEAVQFIRQAKAQGLAVSCDIAAYQLSFLDQALQSFDTNFKVKPPFRSEADRLALLEGLTDGTIDHVCSAHLPCDTESKNLEFDLADFGIIGLETAFGAIRKATAHCLALPDLIEKLTTNPRKLLNLPQPRIAVGEKANLTLFNPDKEWIFEATAIESKSKNTPFVGQTLLGKVEKFKE